MNPGAQDRSTNALSDITVVVVTHNSAHCIAPLAAGLDASMPMIVIDNASDDATREAVQRELPHATFVANKVNRGFGAANNQAIAAATTPYVLLVNPDCTLDTQALDVLRRCAHDHPQAAMVGPQLLDRRGEVDVNYRWASTGWTSRGPGADGALCVGFMTGACMLIRTAPLRAIGGFDEAFFLYYEDDDLCLRLQTRGALIVEPRARVTHHGRGSVGGRSRVRSEFVRGYHHIQSKFLFAHKHLGGAPSAPVRMRYMVLAVLESLMRMVVFDLARGARAWGRARGAWQWQQHPPHRGA
jgi:N-acetylglucosaminyl-diphospho-decaprenol L-rhamnosyltransferase